MDNAEQRLDEQLKTYGLERRATSNLGDCMFDVISDQLMLHKRITTSAKAVQEAVVNWLRANANMSINGATLRFVVDAAEGWDTYCTRISGEFIWGDFPCLVAATHVYNVQIMIWSSFSGDTFITNISEADKPHTLLIRYLDNMHYISLGRLERMC